MSWKLLLSLLHFMCPAYPHSMHVKNFILFWVGFVHTFRHRASLWPTWLHFWHLMMLVSVQSLAWWPTLLHLKHIFSVQSKDSWSSLPQSMQVSLFVSFGHSFDEWPNCLQLKHLRVMLSAAQYLWPLPPFFIMVSKSDSSGSSTAFLGLSLTIPTIVPLNERLLDWISPSSLSDISPTSFSEILVGLYDNLLTTFVSFLGFSMKYSLPLKNDFDLLSSSSCGTMISGLHLVEMVDI